MFNPKYINLPTADLTSQSVNAMVNKLSSDVLNSAAPSEAFAVQLQAKVDGNLRSIGPVHFVKQADTDALKTVFIAPKVYGITLINGNEIIKIKES